MAWPQPPSQAHLSLTWTLPISILRNSPWNIRPVSALCHCRSCFLCLEFFFPLICWMILIIFQRPRSVSLKFQNSYFGLQGSRWPGPATSLLSFHKTLLPHCSQNTLGSLLSPRFPNKPCPRAFVLAFPPAWLALLPTIHMTHSPSQSSSYINIALSGGLHQPPSKTVCAHSYTYIGSLYPCLVCLHDVYHDLILCHLFLLCS